MILPVKRQDAQAIVDIYNYYVENTVITFEENIITVNEMVERIETVTDLNLPWLVIKENNILL